MQVTFYLPVKEKTLKQDFDKACEYFDTKPNHELTNHMKMIVDKHRGAVEYKDTIPPKYEVNQQQIDQIIKETTDYLSGCQTNDSHDFDIDLGDGLVFFAIATISYDDDGIRPRPVGILENVEVIDPSANINYLTDEQIREIESKFNQ